MCKELTEEMNRGKVIATLLADHLDMMGAANCEMPVEVRGKKYTCKCEIARKKFTVDLDEFCRYVVGNVKFVNEAYAREYVVALNDNKVIRTCIPVHDDKCCGYANFYYSALKQEMIAVCSECGLLRELMMNDTETLSIIGPTVSFKEE